MVIEEIFADPTAKEKASSILEPLISPK